MLHNKISALGFGVKSLHKFKTKKKIKQTNKNIPKNHKLTKQNTKIIKGNRIKYLIFRESQVLPSWTSKDFIATPTKNSVISDCGFC